MGCVGVCVVCGGCVCRVSRVCVCRVTCVCVFLAFVLLVCVFSLFRVLGAFSLSEFSTVLFQFHGCDMVLLRICVLL